LSIKIFRRKQAGLPYDGITSPSGECPVPSRQFPQHLYLHSRRNLGFAYLFHG